MTVALCAEMCQVSFWNSLQKRATFSFYLFLFIYFFISVHILFSLLLSPHLLPERRLQKINSYQVNRGSLPYLSDLFGFVEHINLI